MVILRIRQAECAMNDGRLDEAFSLLVDPAIGRHRRGQDVIGRLLRAFVRRCRDHLAGGRLSQALADSDKAARLGGNASQVGEIRTEVVEAMAARRRQAAGAAADLAAARQHIQRGRLTLAAGCLPDNADQLQRDLAQRRAAVEDAADRTQEALDRGDWIAAVDALLESRRNDLTGIRLDGLAAHVTALLCERVRAALVDGRTDRAAVLLGRLTALASPDPQVQELDSALRQCRQAADWLGRGRPDRAEEALRRLTSIVPQAAWAASAADRCAIAASEIRDLRAGPLGLLQAAATEQDDPPSAAESAPLEPTAVPTPPAAPSPPAAELPETFWMRIDGVGSYLVARGEAVTIGPISSAEHPQVGLLADPSIPAVTLERIDEDYFLRSPRPVTVNDQETTDAMLTGGEKIALSSRCRLTFTRPNAASTSAVLSLSGTRLPQADARHIILLDSQLVLAGGSMGHIRADDLDEPIVLCVSDGKLLCRALPARTPDGKTADPAGSIPMNTPVRVGPVTMVLTAV